MSNFEIEVDDIVRTIQQRLESYAFDGGSTVLRELLQNADDAGAERATFVLFEQGIGDADLSLLHGPALVAINDGPFEERHRRALVSHSRTSKAGERSAVGQFGIGQQSVFHICEAFCFLGSGQAGLLRGMLNPWFDSHLDDENRARGDVEKGWDTLSEKDAGRIQEAVAEVIPGDKWFLLWVPLRLEEQRRRVRTGGDRSSDCIREHFSTDLLPNLGEALASRDLVLLLPQMGSLKEVRGLISSAPPLSGRSLVREKSACHEGPARLSRLEYPRELDTRPRVGRVIESEGTETRDHFVHLTERCVIESELNAWSDDFERRGLKALPHGGVTLVRSPAEGVPEFRFRWAVYFPLLKQPPPRALATGTWSWTLTLHSFGFLDSGRQRLEGLGREAAAPSPEEKLRRRWNRAVLERAALPDLLPAVADAVADLPGDEVRPLIDALRRELDSLDVSPRSWGCDRALLRLASEDRWVLVDRASVGRIVQLPEPPPEAATTVGQLVSGLGDLTSVIFDGALLASDPPDRWRESEVMAVLRSAVEHARKTWLLAYLRRWLVRVAATDAEMVGRCLLRFAWAVAARAQLPSDANQLGQAWQSLLELGNLGRALFVRPALRPEIARLAQAVPDADVVVLPSSIRPAAIDREAEFPVGAVAPLLRWLSAPTGNADEESGCLESLQLRILLALGPARLRALHGDPEMRSVPCFVLHSGREGTLSRHTPVQVRRLLEEGRLFVLDGTHRPEAAIRELAMAAADASFDIFAVRTQSKREREAWGNALSVPSLSESSLLAPFMGASPVTVHSDPSHRRPLLARLLEKARRNPSAEERRALRYLCHGDSARFRSDEALWALPTSLEREQAELEAKLIEAAGLDSRLLPQQIADLPALSRSWCSTLGIVDLDGETLGNVCLQLEPEELRSSFRGHSVEAREGILVRLEDHDEAAKRIPVHRLAEPRTGFAAADEGMVCWTDGDELPAVLARAVKTVELSSRRQVREIQQKLLTKWDDVARLRMALEASERDGASVELAREVGVALVRTADIPPEARSARWLPIGGTGVAPSSVVRLPSPADQALAKLPELGLHAFDSVDPAIARLVESCEVIPDEAESFRRLSSALRDKPEVSLEISVAARRDDVVKLRELVKTTEEARLLADIEWLLLATAPPEAAEHLVTTLTASVASKRWVDRFARLSDARVPPTALCPFLKAAAAEPQFWEAIVPEVTLPCADGEWRSSGSIAREGRNLAPQFRLHPDIERALASSREAAEPTDGGVLAEAESEVSNPSSVDLVTTCETVKKFFEPWFARSVSPGAAAVFVSAIVRPTDPMAELVQEWAPYGDCKQLQDDLERQCPLRGGASNAARVARRNTSTLVSIRSGGDEVCVDSLTGTQLRARVSSDERNAPYDLIVGELPELTGRKRTIHLRAPGDDCGREELNAALEDAVKRVIAENLHRYPSPAFDAFWAKLTDDGQSHVAVARMEVLRDLPSTLDHLSCKGDPEIASARNELRRARVRVDALKEEGAEESLIERARDEADRAHEALVELVSSEAKSAYVLERLRRKLEDYQYSPAKVVFELLQNADDAVVQAHGPLEGGPPVAARRAEISVSGSGPPVLRVSHRGRLINARGADPEEGRRAGYDLDLHNMLRLNVSDKVEQQGSTGRFGLGFKSIHLITDRPRVRSGRMSFEIVAGLLPEPAASEVGADPEVTEICAPLGAGVEGVMPAASFLALFPLFARGLGALRISTATGVANHQWNPTHRHRLPNGDVLELGWGMEGVEGVDGCLAVTRWREGKRLVVCVGLRSDGTPVRLPPDVPSLWVTAPTNAAWDLGLALAGPFEVDVGRSELALNRKENEDVARSLGEMFAEAVEALHGSGPNDIATALEPALTDARFAAALFDVCSGGNALQILKEKSQRGDVLKAFHTRGRGLSALAHTHVPTGLDGKTWSQVVSVADIDWVLGGRSSRALLSVILPLRETAGLEELPLPGRLISEESYDALRAIGLDTKPRKFDVPALLDIMGRARKHFSPEWASPLVRLSRNSGLEVGDRERLRAWLQQLEFPSRGGPRRRANELLVPDVADAVLPEARRSDLRDEALRAAFAPDSFVLAEEWLTQDGLAVFLGARSQLRSGGVADLAKWAKGLSDAARQCDVLRYVLCGRLQLAPELRSDMPRWLPRERPTKPGASPFTGFSDDEFVRLVGELYPLRSINELRDFEVWRLGSKAPSEPPRRDVGLLLREILERHRRSGEARLRDLDRELYGRPLALSLDPSSSGERQAWLALFTRASLLRWGWGGEDGRQHRGFMRHAWEKDWFRRFADASDKNDCLSQILAEYQDGLRIRATFSHWLPALFFTHYFARHLDDFVDRFFVLDRAAITEFRRTRDLAAALDARGSSSESGGGYDLPPLSILRHGLPFLIRELRRRRPEPLLGSPKWDSLAFPAVARIRRFSEQLGGPSDLAGRTPVEASMAFDCWLRGKLKDDATFDRAYDLPIRWHAEAVGVDVGDGDEDE